MNVPIKAIFSLKIVFTSYYCIQKEDEKRKTVVTVVNIDLSIEPSQKKKKKKDSKSFMPTYNHLYYIECVFESRARAKP